MGALRRLSLLASRAALAGAALLLMTPEAVAREADPHGEVRAPADRALAVTLPDGVAVTLDPGAHGRWLPRGRLPSETNGWAVGYHLVLVEGEAEVRMPEAPKGSHAFLVQTRAGTLTDWRGKLHVMVHDDRTTAAIYEGALVVGSNGQGFPVYDGAGIVMHKGVDPDKSRGIPPAPVWDAGHGASSLVVEPQGAQGTVGVAWKPVPGATSYRVALAHDPGMTSLAETAVTGDTSYAMVERGGGGFWATVRAVGAEGIVGEWSAPRPLRVLHFALHPGASVAHDGTIVLPPHGSISLADAQGLQMAYGAPGLPAASLYWSPLGSSLRLPDDTDVRVIHLRDPALGQETSITLARRALRADVEMTPRNPPPGATIDVRVTAWDPTRRLDPAQEKITLAAALDLDPLPVAWQQSGATWTARITPRTTFRPTVLRVTATDGSGAEIGRGFVEIPP